ncbi:ArsR/SmtB family transcription factor [Streptomyces orinoci]|uniref:Helix-turn-helix transcriptional regulator n=1 Tax=Streptomyces orinoci TaxID=67339 RepID=A0ABV3JUW3_STRON|nr:helix-turn-helix transcriptional regulator [Streptomyces orinoci]
MKTQPPAPGRPLDHPSRDQIRLEDVLHALADPLRLKIVHKLAVDCGGHACSDFDLPVSKSTTTHHFRVLRESGVIAQEYQGTSKVSELRREDLDALFPGLLDSVLAACGRRFAAADG